MWIALRIALAVVGLAIRLRHRRSQPAADGKRGDTPYFVVKKKVGGEPGFAIGMPLESPAWIRLHRGTWANHLAKRLRVSSEVHTGDPKFDDDIYITCDHPAAPGLFAERADLRAAVIAALEAGYRHIEFDGSNVWIRRASSAVAPSGADISLLDAIHTAAKPLEAGLPHRFADNFIWHALVLEALVWTILVYAVAAFLRFYIRFVDIHVFRTAIALRAIPVALVLLALVLFLVYRWMRGTPRGQLLIVESVAVLVVGLPIASLQVVADTNRGLDTSEPTIVSRTFDHCETREHRRERATWYSHHVWLRESGGEPALPTNIRVPDEVCAAGKPGDTIEITLGAGRWGVPYYRKIQIHGMTYEP